MISVPSSYIQYRWTSLADMLTVVVFPAASRCPTASIRPASCLQMSELPEPESPPWSAFTGVSFHRGSHRGPLVLVKVTT